MQKMIRKKLRLKDYDYSSQGCYFITVCTHQKQNLFGDGETLSIMGKIACEELELVEKRISGISVEKYIVMPNHIHAIIVIGCEYCDKELTVETYFDQQKFMNLEQIVQLYKAGVTRRIHKEIDENVTVWQKSFYDVILDNQDRYDNAWYYIENNPIESKLKKSKFGFLGDD